MNALEVRDLHHAFAGLKVLDGVSLEIRAGERHAVIGPNGAGKSTLFNIITGRIPAQRGRITYRGRDITGMPPHRTARLGLGRSFQVINVFPRLTVYENVLGARLSHAGRRLDGWTRTTRYRDVADQTDAVLRALGLRPRRDAPAGTLSYGEQRRLELALTVAGDPDLILLDEPTAGLNREESLGAVDLIRGVTEGRTLVMVEHDMDVVFGLADRISVLHYGRVLATGTPEAIRRSDEVQSAYLGRKADAARG